jgi:hypothetical protein
MCGMNTSHEIKTRGQEFVEYALSSLEMAIGTFVDPRAGHHNLKYEMKEIAIGAFSVFFMRNESFLESQRHMESAQGINNLRSIFGVEQIPSDNYIRSILDNVSPEHLEPVFLDILNFLQSSGHLNCFHVSTDRLLIAIDGTQYHSSKNIYCDKCSKQEHSNGTVSYSHTVVMPVLVRAGTKQTLPLFPEFIVPQDGHLKQDCETAAAKRLIVRNADMYREMKAIFLGDDLYSSQPMCQILKEQSLDFVFVCKPTSHKILYELIASLDEMDGIESLDVHRKEKGKFVTDSFRFVSNVPIKGGSDALDINWCEIVTTNSAGEEIYRNSFATSLLLTKETVASVCEYGRARWKIENENNNTLKNLGYNLEHNFGHGQLYLASMLATMNILAFLMHNALEIVDEDFRQLVEKLKRSNVFKHAAVLTCYICFGAWQHLTRFMITSFDELHQPPTPGQIYYHPSLVPPHNST